MDNVNHPYHYEGTTSIECIESMEIVFGKFNVAVFCIVNAYKYIWRHKHKNGLEDLEKAKWYLDRAESYGMEGEDEGFNQLRNLLEKKVKQWQESHPLSDSTSSTP